MNATADRPEFLPPDPGGHTKAIGLAVLAHLVLAAGLTWGLRWKSSTDTPMAEAELWASVPQQAAPRAVEPPPAPPAPRPAPPPPQRAAPEPENADIVRERERKQLEEKKRQEAQEQEARERRQREQKAAQEKQRAQEQKERAEKERADKLAADKKREEAQRQQQVREQQEAKRREEDRKANLQRIAGMANATGGPSATGTAAQSAGPSASYGSRVAAKVKPNIVFTENPVGNPAAEVEVRSAPDGTITSRRLVKSSGIKAWDEAVLRAIDKTETLPRDTDGRSVPAVMVISFRPQD